MKYLLSLTAAATPFGLAALATKHDDPMASLAMAVVAIALLVGAMVAGNDIATVRS